MKLALLSVDEHLMQIARAAANAGEHAVAVICDGGPHAAELMRLFPAARLEADWETLTLGGDFDRLLVGRTGAEAASLREEQLRRLVQAGVPAIAVHPAAEAIVLHELAMIQRDVGGLLAPLNPIRQHAGVRRLLAWLRANANALGSVTQVHWQRQIAAHSPDAALALLACDADVLQEIAGKLDRVSAMMPAASDQPLWGLSVNLAGTAQALVHWVARRDDAAAGDELRVVAEQGQISLRCLVQGGGWELKPALRGAASESIHGDGNLARELLEYVTQPDASWAQDRWNAACRAVELAEAAKQSLGRGRTIQLHYEEHSEQQTFKSVMAAGGCLLLSGLMAAVGAIAVLDAIAGPARQNVWFRLWPIYVFIPIALFLLLQTLWRVFAAAPAKPAASWQRSEGVK